ncbi:Paramyosin, short form [Frankliniella fusca]|uniref:Paramyosin, short form n=1 Tax=Frankliniella fusca TaxID=407009 RepID=A0AAE1GQX2_9NEOP|nr:Paramyosin, short form [Frankliniella fusca]
MSSRTILSRPRTRLYDCNYNIGQSYYKPMMDHLDRKYSGRPTEMPNAYPATRPVNQEEQDLFRTRRAGSALIGDFEDPFLAGSTPEVGRKPLSGAASAALREFDDIFENRPSARGERERGGAGLRASSLAAPASNGYDIDDAIEEVRRARARRMEDAEQDVEDSVSVRRRNLVAMKNEREQSLADRALETVGLRKLDLGLDGDASSSSSTVVKRRVLRVTQDVESSAAKQDGDLTRWTKVNAGSPLALESASEAAAISRARQTRNRLQDLEAEMEDLAERSALRERRAAQLRSLVAEQSADRAEEDSSYRSVKSSLRSEKKTVTF